MTMRLSAVRVKRLPSAPSCPDGDADVVPRVGRTILAERGHLDVREAHVSQHQLDLVLEIEPQLDMVVFDCKHLVARTL